MDMYGVLEVLLYALFTSTLVGGDWLVSCPVCFTPTEGVFVPIMGLDTVEYVTFDEVISVA
jgi:hypothetical protein